MLSATVGTGQLIDGLDAGLIALCPTDRATLLVPPERALRAPAVTAVFRADRSLCPHLMLVVAYGKHGAGELIPGGATLLLEVEVLAVRWPNARTSAPDIFREIDSSDDGELDMVEVSSHFARLGKEVPPELWKLEDQNRDSKISWEEFGGPKGLRPGVTPHAPALQQHVAGVHG